MTFDNMPCLVYWKCIIDYILWWPGETGYCGGELCVVECESVSMMLECSFCGTVSSELNDVSIKTNVEVVLVNVEISLKKSW